MQTHRSLADTAEVVDGSVCFYFGCSDSPVLFGCYHEASLPETGVHPDVGVVLCNPLGFEEVAGHRGIRQLAKDCALAKVPCLRFDYPGCGNSHLNESDGFEIEQWLASISSAIEALKRLGGVKKVILVGFRLGAALAFLSGSQRTDVCGLILVSPVVSGRRFVKELRLLSKPISKLSGSANQETELEPNGFLLSNQTRASIEKINLVSVVEKPQRLLVIDAPGESPRTSQWVDHLIANENRVEQMELYGFEGLVDDPQTSVVPLEMFHKITSMISIWRDEELALTSSTATVDEHAVVDSSLNIFGSSTVFDPLHTGVDFQVFSDHEANRLDSGSLIQESAVALPADGYELFGILAQPITGSVTGSVVLLNAGKVRNIGPNRFWVGLAREWACRGFRVLRIDVSGIGESPEHENSQVDVSYANSTVGELTAISKYMKGRDDVDLHIVGLCSGGYQALRAAVGGLSVESISLINPLAFDHRDLGDESQGSIANYQVLNFSQQYRERLATKAFWNELVRGRLDLFNFGKVLQRRLNFSLQLYLEKLRRVIPLGQHSDVAEDFDRLLERGVAINLIFAEESPGYKLLTRRLGGQFNKLLRDSRFSLRLIPHADHTFTRSASRRELRDTLEQSFFSSG